MDGNDWMKDLRDKAEHYQEPEPEGLWQDILASSRRRAAGKRKRSVRILSAVASIAAAAAMALYFLPRPGLSVLPQSGGSRLLVADAERLSEPDSSLAVLSQNITGASDPGSVTAISETVQVVAAGKTYSVPETVAEDVPAAESTLPRENTLTEETGISTDGTLNVKEEGTGADHALGEHARDAGMQMNQAGQMPYDFAEQKQRKFGISAQVYYSNVPGSMSRGTGFSSLVSSAALDMDQTMSVLNAGVVDGAALFAVEDQLSAEVRHRQPVRVGATVRFHLPGRWGLETGLTYSLLESETDAGTSSRYFHTRRMLHYLGIPLKVTYDAVRKKHWSLYLSAGGMLEKNISGKADVDFMVDGVNVSSRKENVLIRELQWSLNAAAGIEVRLAHAIGLYAEPGVSWFIDNGSSIETVYQSRPVNFNLELGLRYHF